MPSSPIVPLQPHISNNENNNNINNNNNTNPTLTSPSSHSHHATSSSASSPVHKSSPPPPSDCCLPYFRRRRVAPQKVVTFSNEQQEHHYHEHNNDDNAYANDNRSDVDESTGAVPRKTRWYFPRISNKSLCIISSCLIIFLILLLFGYFYHRAHITSIMKSYFYTSCVPYISHVNSLYSYVLHDNVAVKHAVESDLRNTRSNSLPNFNNLIALLAQRNLSAHVSYYYFHSITHQQRGFYESSLNSPIVSYATNTSQFHRASNTSLYRPLIYSSLPSVNMPLGTDLYSLPRLASSLSSNSTALLYSNGDVHDAASYDDHLLTPDNHQQTFIILHQNINAFINNTYVNGSLVFALHLSSLLDTALLDDSIPHYYADEMQADMAIVAALNNHAPTVLHQQNIVQPNQQDSLNTDLTFFEEFEPAQPSPFFSSFTIDYYPPDYYHALSIGCIAHSSYISSTLYDGAHVFLALGLFFGVALFIASYLSVYHESVHVLDRHRLHSMLYALDAAREDAEAAGNAKSDFMAFLCHELRNPLHAVMSMADVLKESKLDQDQAESVFTIHASSELMLAITNDILDLSKIQAGRIVLEFIPVDVTAMVKSLVRANIAFAAEQGVRLIGNIDAAVPRYIVADPTRLNQLITNLLANAIKFTPVGGTVCLELALKDAAPTRNVIDETDEIISVVMNDHMRKLGLTSAPSHMEDAVSSRRELDDEDADHESRNSHLSDQAIHNLRANSRSAHHVPYDENDHEHAASTTVHDDTPSNHATSMPNSTISNLEPPTVLFTSNGSSLPPHSSSSSSSLPAAPPSPPVPPPPSLVSARSMPSQLQLPPPSSLSPRSDVDVNGLPVREREAGITPHPLHRHLSSSRSHAHSPIFLPTSPTPHPIMHHSLIKLKAGHRSVHSISTSHGHAHSNFNISPVQYHNNQNTNYQPLMIPGVVASSPNSPSRTLSSFKFTAGDKKELSRTGSGVLKYDRVTVGGTASHTSSPRLFALSDGRVTHNNNNSTATSDRHLNNVPSFGTDHSRTSSIQQNALPPPHKSSHSRTPSLSIIRSQKTMRLDTQLEVEREPSKHLLIPIPDSPHDKKPSNLPSPASAAHKQVQSPSTISLVFRVKDTGIGIPKEYMSCLFEPYSQAKRSMTREHGGTGLGLAIVKRLADLMQGTIGVESELGKGTTFSFSCDFELAPPPAPHSAASYHFQHQAGSALPSPNRAQQQTFDTALQVQSPSHHGEPTAITIQPPTPMNKTSDVAAAPSANTTNTSQELVLPSPAFANSSTTPASSSLISTISPSSSALSSASPISPAAISPTTPAATAMAVVATTAASNDTKASPSPSAPAQSLPHILVVDDAQINRRIMARMLNEIYTVDEAENGAVALELVNSHPPNYYVAILMDLMMPVMGGSEALSHLRRQGHSLPIIAVTANTMNEDVDRCLSMGFDGFLSKPCRKEQVRAIIKDKVAQHAATAHQHQHHHHAQHNAGDVIP